MSKETKITPLDTDFTGDLQEIMGEYGGGALDSLTAHDVVMPRYKLIQNTSRVGTPGKWSSNTDPDLELDELNIIILDISTYRVMFPPQGQGDRPICRSNDGYSKADINGVGDGNCSSCRFSTWSKDPVTGRNIKPGCSSGYTLLGIIFLPDGSSTPGMVSLKGSAIRPLKQFFTRMKSRNIPSFAYITNIKAASETNDLGRFFKPVFEFGETLSMEAIKSAALQAKSFKQYISSDIMADTDSDIPEAAPASGAASFTNMLDNYDGDNTGGDFPF